MDINVTVKDSMIEVVFSDADKKIETDFWREKGFGATIYAPETGKCVVITAAMMHKLKYNSDIEHIMLNHNISDDTKADAIKLLLLERFEDELEELG